VVLAGTAFVTERSADYTPVIYTKLVEHKIVIMAGPEEAERLRNVHFFPSLAGDDAEDHGEATASTGT